MPGFVAFSHDGRHVACGGHGKDIALFDPVTGALQCELSGHEHPPTAAVFLPDGRLVSGGEEGALRMWDPEKKTSLATWYTVSADPSRNWHDDWVGYTPSGKFIGSASGQRLVGWQRDGEVLVGSEAQSAMRVETLLVPSQ